MEYVEHWPYPLQHSRSDFLRRHHPCTVTLLGKTDQMTSTGLALLLPEDWQPVYQKNMKKQNIIVSVSRITGRPTISLDQESENMPRCTS